MGTWQKMTTGLPPTKKNRRKQNHASSKENAEEVVLPASNPYPQNYERKR